ncbi:nucleotidyl transferase AbiEii/AbiGii toxin family protein [Streptomyces sp. NPDC048255]|uniref:nucleotidyl transferase AbiEii/AbiGii toxin family protein n=1 Tax=Streptomyces sp. NPDC048255 TaxID=3154713 RepID=UPI0033D8C559
MSSAGEPWKPSIPGGPDDIAESEADRLHRKGQLPRTLTAGVGAAAARHKVFDPALKHFDEAYRPTDEVVSDPAVRVRWQAARRTALAVTLRAVASSGWAGSLVLRGSMLMSGWYPGVARDPHDLDFVVVPQDWRIEEPRTRLMLDAVASAAERAAAEHGGLVMPASEAVSEYIWTYERVPGHRLVLPWSAPGLPGGHVQLDFVFHEELPVAPEISEVAGTGLRGATRELSLAWKLLWLATDMYPQGKDLYDAVLLAEDCVVPYPLLETVFRQSGEWQTGGVLDPLTLGTFEGLDLSEWPEFAREYPEIGDGPGAYVRRLVAALAPTFAGAGRSFGGAGRS